ncbi:UNVERIFIED_CONTAM: hypothetical protein HDU68_008294 [Siphonaria sp. JEL0065]|nr:hypothetical protein HDU68_008294 [Siphonaria sp. JEL0065]
MQSNEEAVDLLLNLSTGNTSTNSNSNINSHLRRPTPCVQCRSQRKKCSTGHPCVRCNTLDLSCVYDARKPYTRKVLPKAKAITQLDPTHPVSSTATAPATPPVCPSLTMDHSETNATRHLLSASSVSKVPPQHARNQNREISPIPSLTQRSPVIPHSSSPISESPIASSAVKSQSAESVITMLALKYQSEIAALTKRPLPCDCCRQQKKKCDRLRPSCTTCLKRGLICQYILPPQKQNQPKWRARLLVEGGDYVVGNVAVKLEDGAFSEVAPACEHQRSENLNLGVGVMRINALLD